MNGFTRIIGFLFALVTLVFTVGALLYLFGLGSSTTIIDDWAGNPVGFWIIIGLTLFIALVSIGLLMTSLMRSSSSNGFLIETTDG